MARYLLWYSSLLLVFFSLFSIAFLFLVCLFAVACLKQSEEKRWGKDASQAKCVSFLHVLIVVFVRCQLKCELDLHIAIGREDTRVFCSFCFPLSGLRNNEGMCRVTLGKEWSVNESIAEEKWISTSLSWPGTCMFLMLFSCLKVCCSCAIWCECWLNLFFLHWQSVWWHERWNGLEPLWRCWFVFARICGKRCNVSWGLVFLARAVNAWEGDRLLLPFACLGQCGRTGEETG